MKEILLAVMGVLIFFSLYKIMDVKWTPSFHKQRLLKIKHIGDSSFIKYRIGNQKLMVMKYQLDSIKAIKAHKKKISNLLEMNHIYLDVSNYIIYKVFASVSLITLTIVLIIKSYNGDMLDTFILNGNTLITSFVVLYCILYLDISFLQFRYNLMKKRIKEEIPFFSTIFQMSIESGDNTFNALSEAVAESSGLLKKEFEIVLSEVQSGIPLPDSLIRMDERLKIEEVSSFVSFIRRVNSASYNDFATFTEKYRINMLMYELNAAKEYEKTVPQKLTGYNSLTFAADFILSIAPIAFTLFYEMAF